MYYSPDQQPRDERLKNETKETGRTRIIRKAQEIKHQSGEPSNTATHFRNEQQESLIHTDKRLND